MYVMFRGWKRASDALELEFYTLYPLDARAHIQGLLQEWLVHLACELPLYHCYLGINLLGLESTKKHTRVFLQRTN